MKLGKYPCHETEPFISQQKVIRRCKYLQSSVTNIREMKSLIYNLRRTKGATREMVNMPDFAVSVLKDLKRDVRGRSSVRV